MPCRSAGLVPLYCVARPLVSTPTSMLVTDWRLLVLPCLLCPPRPASSAAYTEQYKLQYSTVQAVTRLSAIFSIISSLSG